MGGDNGPPVDHWTETVTANGKTTDPGSLAGNDPITCSSLATCADYYLKDAGYPLDVGTVGAGPDEFSLFAKGSDDRQLGFPGWSAIINAKTYAPIAVEDGESCSHCYYLSYQFHLTPRR